MSPEEIVASQVGAVDAGLPYSQAAPAGAMLADRARVNRGVDTRRVLADVIAASEGTSAYNDPYAVGFGGVKLDTSRPHPGNVGKFRGKPVSAAGKYQFTLATWKDAHGGKNVPMTPDNQEKALDYLLRRGGVNDRVLESGDIGAVLPKLGRIWAALPTSTADQPKRSMEFLVEQMRKSGASKDMLASLDAAALGAKHKGSALSPDEVKRAVTPRVDEELNDSIVRAQAMQVASAQTAQDQAHAQAAGRTRRVETMISDALNGTSKLVVEPDGLPTKYDDQLLKIIRAA